MKNCETQACCEAVWSSGTQSCCPADFSHPRVWGSISRLGLDKHFFSWGSYPQPIPLKGKSIATPIICTAGGGEWFQGFILRIRCSVMNQASSHLLNQRVQEKLSHCCLFRTMLADKLGTLWPLQTMTAAQIMTVIVAKLFPYCFYQQHFSCHRHSFCPTPMLSFYSADNPPVVSFLYAFPVVLFFWLKAPFTCQQGVFLSEC